MIPCLSPVGRKGFRPRWRLVCVHVRRHAVLRRRGTRALRGYALIHAAAYTRTCTRTCTCTSTSTSTPTPTPTILGPAISHALAHALAPSVVSATHSLGHALHHTPRPHFARLLLRLGCAVVRLSHSSPRGLPNPGPASHLLIALSTATPRATAPSSTYNNVPSSLLPLLPNIGPPSPCPRLVSARLAGLTPTKLLRVKCQPVCLPVMAACRKSMWLGRPASHHTRPRARTCFGQQTRPSGIPPTHTHSQLSSVSSKPSHHDMSRLQTRPPVPPPPSLAPTRRFVRCAEKCPSDKPAL